MTRSRSSRPSRTDEPLAHDGGSAPDILGGVRIAAELLTPVIEHARADHPNECCGLIAVRDGVAVSVHRTENLAASPLRFEVDGMELHRLLTDIEDRGDAIGAIYHSHTRSAPYPSQTDVNFAGGWPGVEWLIVGLAEGGPEVRSYFIDSGTITEVPVEVTGG